MGQTIQLGLPYPDPDDAPDGPYALQQLAEGVEAGLASFPPPLYYSGGNASGLGTSGAFVDLHAEIPDTTFYTPENLVCLLQFGCRHKVQGSGITASSFQLKITDPNANVLTTSQVADQMGEGYLRSINGSQLYQSQNCYLPWTFKAGTSTLRVQGYGDANSTSTSLVGLSILVTPLRWASTYAEV